MRSHRENFSRGFTLVELLVVITIIGLLAALIVPAVQGALETARTNTCRNNLVQVGKASFGYATRKNTFPGYVNPKLHTSQAANTSWQIALLNDMDRASLYNAWVNNDTTQTGNNATNLEFYVCPSDNTAVGQTGAFTSFVVNTGKTGNQTNGSDVWDGLCHDLADTANAGKRKVATDAIPDGADVTILASENLDADKYTAVAENILGFQFGTANPYINKTPKPSTGRPSSNHAGVVNVVFAGGSAKTIDEAIDFNVWNQLMTPDGKKAGTLTPLQEGSY